MDAAPETSPDDADEEPPPVRGELFGTETMAELCVRQGRLPDALAIYRGLLRTAATAVEGTAADERRQRWEQRLRELLDPSTSTSPATPTATTARPPAAIAPNPLPAAAPPGAGVSGGTRGLAGSLSTVPAPPAGTAAGAVATKTLRGAIHRLPMVLREPVRAGQIVYAEKNDLIVVGPVNPGAQLIADGNIHVYGRLRGRAVAGAHGAAQARIYCQRLEAELVGIDSAYLTAEDLPPSTFGRAVQIFWEAGRCVILPL